MEYVKVVTLIVAEGQWLRFGSRAAAYSTLCRIH